MAKPFRLRKVLAYRARLEQEQIGAVAQARAATSSARAALEALRTRRRESHAEALAARQGALAVDAAAREAFYDDALSAAIDAQELSVQATERAQQAAETELLQRRQERRALETLRDRHEERERERDQRREAALNDEVAMARAARRQIAGLRAG